MLTPHYVIPALSLCSQSHMPCHVPRFSFPFVIGTDRDTPNSDDLTCAMIFVTNGRV